MSLEENTPIQSPDSTEKPSIPEKIEIASDSTNIIEPVPPTIKGQLAELLRAIRNKDDSSRDFLLRVVQPGLAGLMDGSVSTLAPIFATAFATHNSTTTFLVGMASATGAGISMAFSEGLSDDGQITGRGSPAVRGGITGIMTFFGGSLHTLPFLISSIHLALLVAYVVVAFELVLIAAIRHRYFGTNWLISTLQVVGGGALVFAAAFIFGNA
jgi:erythrin-vacuolar iron transport family protein